MRKRLLVLSAALCLMFTACKPYDTGAERDFYAMNTIMSVTVYGRGAETCADEVQQRINKLDKLWSVTDEGSEIYALNSSGSAAVSEETAELVKFALRIADRSGGALDPTIYPVLKTWGFTTGEYTVPGADELARLTELVDHQKVTVSGNTVTLGEGMMLDFGAVAKGAASDEAARILRESGIQSALINLGGNVMTVGSKPDGSKWRIGVKDPTGEGNIGVLSLSDCAAVTSGAYERYFQAEDGTVYGHIIDPESGYPVDNELLSATIISPNGTLCDALSTAVFVMGTDKAEELWRSWDGEEDFDMLLITKGGEAIITEGAAELFSLSNKSLTLKVVERQ